MTTEFAPPAVTSASRIPSVKLGEELPLFCEKCGYGLQGALQVRCEHCSILQFHCPECGHHQPINTLRPAAQRIIGRLRSLWLGWVVFFKLNYFGWLLFAWFAMGVEWSYSYETYRTARGSMYGGPSVRTAVSFEMLIAFGLFAFAFGLVSRIFLLRWRSAAVVGLILAGLVILAIHLGAYFRFAFNSGPKWSLNGAWLGLFAWTGGLLVLGSMLAWPLWVGVVKIFLPAATGENFLNYQRSLSDRPVAGLAKD